MRLGVLCLMALTKAATPPDGGINLAAGVK